MKTYESVHLHHDVYGNLECIVLNRENGILTLWCKPFVKEIHFDDPGDEFYSYASIKIAHKAENEGYPFGYVLEINPTEELESSDSDQDDKKATVRYSDIKAYGNNQWPCCSLRKYLNHEFLEGFSADIREAMVQTTNTLLLTVRNVTAEKKKPKESPAVVVDEFLEVFEKIVHKKRYTYAICTDNVYLPSIDLLKSIDTDILMSLLGESQRYIWLLNPSQLFFDDFSVSFARWYYDEFIKQYHYTITYCNANSMNITAAPIFRIQESAVSKDIVSHQNDTANNTDKWNWPVIDEGRFYRSRDLRPVEVTNNEAVFVGKHGTYTCNLEGCNCSDFLFNLAGKNQPCKHILALGAYLHAYDPEEVDRLFEGKKALEKLALAYGHYHLLDDPIMEDDEYDALKKKWANLLPSDKNSKTDINREEQISLQLDI